MFTYVVDGQQGPHSQDVINGLEVVSKNIVTIFRAADYGGVLSLPLQKAMLGQLIIDRLLSCRALVDCGFRQTRPIYCELTTTRYLYFNRGLLA